MEEKGEGTPLELYDFIVNVDGVEIGKGDIKDMIRNGKAHTFKVFRPAKLAVEVGKGTSGAWGLKFAHQEGTSKILKITEVLADGAAAAYNAARGEADTEILAR